MRITEHEKNAIIKAVKAIDPDAKVWLFGSCVDKYCEKYLVDGV